MSATANKTELRLKEQEETLTVSNERSIMGGYHYVYVEAGSGRPGQTFSVTEALRYAKALGEAALAAATAQAVEEREQREYDRLYGGKA